MPTDLQGGPVPKAPISAPPRTAPTAAETIEAPTPDQQTLGAAGAEAQTGRGRVRNIQDWLGRRADTRVGRLSLQWFRAYFEASHNSGCAASIYSALSVLPGALVAVALFHLTASDANAFADRLISHLKLDDTTAGIVRDTFASASSNALAATIAVAIGFLLWGIGIGQIYQDVYARAWRIKVGSIADQGRFTVFFFVVTGAVALTVVTAERLRETGWYAVLPAWLIASTVFWLWVPRFLLHGKIGYRALLPGALLATVVLGGAAATSPLFLAESLKANGQAFGSFGVVLTVIGSVFVMITMSLVCAVFSPVWASWRESERQRAAKADPEP
jgi:membrane protein